jgi:hypothetical protein
MDTLTLQEFLAALEAERSIKLTRYALLRYLKFGKVEGAIMGKDKSGVRRAWVIPRAAVQSFQLVKRGNPKFLK